jgi:multiple sugar transport system permease protein
MAVPTTALATPTLARGAASSDAALRGIRAGRRRRRLTVLAFLSPWLVGFTVFFAYPLVMTVYYSFNRFDLLTPPHWVGMANYTFFLHKDPDVWKAVHNTIWLTVVMVPLRMVFGLFVAVSIVRVKRGAGFFRTVAYLPSLAPPVAATIAFVFLLNPATGPVNRVLKLVGVNGPLWFNDPSWSKPGLVSLSLWGVGDIMIIFLAGLLNVPGELYEAACLDGANAWRRFRHITIPTISPVLMFAAVTGVIQTLQYFTQAAVAAQVASGKATVGEGIGNQLGYPQMSTMTFPELLYTRGFANYLLGYASALAVVLFVVAFAFTALLLSRARSFFGGEAA